MLKLCLILSAACTVTAFVPTPGPLSLRTYSHRLGPLNIAMNGAQNSRDTATSSVSQINFSRKEAVSAITAALTLVFSQNPAYSEEKAACTYANCPPPPADAPYELTLFQVSDTLIFTICTIRQCE